MHIFLDSNIFFKKWFLDSSQFRLIFHFLNNECKTMYLSQLVVEEVKNKYRTLAAKTFGDLQRGAEALKAFYPDCRIDLPVLGDFPDYDLESLIMLKVDDVSVISYDSIPQAEVVSRAIASKRPFQEGEKGYRDTLIWLSFLRHLKAEQVDGDVAFITTNSKDFMGSDKGVFHPDLIEDLAAAGLTCKVHVYSSISEFISGNVNSEDHLIDEAKVEALVEDYLEDEGIFYLERMSPAHVLELENHLFFGERVLANSSSISASLFEGMEDLDFDVTKDAGANNVFIAATYELRIVEIHFDLTLHDYEIYKGVIAKSDFVFDVDVNGGVVSVKSMVRPYYEVSFIFNVSTELCDGYYVDGLSFKRSNRSRLAAANRGD